MYFLLDRISRDGWQARVSIEHERNCECSVDIISANFCVFYFGIQEGGTDVRIGEEK